MSLLLKRVSRLRKGHLLSQVSVNRRVLLNQPTEVYQLRARCLSEKTPPKVDFEAMVEQLEKDLGFQVKEFEKSTLNLLTKFKRQVSGYSFDTSSTVTSELIRNLPIEEVDQYETGVGNKYKVAFDFNEYKVKDLRAYLLGHKVIIDRHKEVKGKGDLKTVKEEILPEEVDPQQVRVIFDKANKFFIIEAPLPDQVDAKEVRKRYEAKIKEMAEKTEKLKQDKGAEEAVKEKAKKAEEEKEKKEETDKK